jgi:hypothetical protein
LAQRYEYTAVALPDITEQSPDEPVDRTAPESREQAVTRVLNSFAARGWRVIALHPAQEHLARSAYALLERPATAKPANNGASWAESDYLDLAEGLRVGLDDQGLAATLGRTPGAIVARARKLLRTIGIEDPELEDLRTEVVGNGRDVMSLARAVHATDGPYLWTRADDERLREAWATAAPALPDLAAEFGVTTKNLAARFVRVEIADTNQAVEARFGRTTEP